MAQSDWDLEAGSLGSGIVKRVYSAAFLPPNGGGDFTAAMRSTDPSNGAVCFFHNGVSFAPTTKGGIISGCFKKFVSGGGDGWTPFIYINAQGSNVSDERYMLGLSNSDPAHIVLVKGAPTGGLFDVAAPANPGDPLNQGVMRRSTDVVEIGEWVHLRLMVASNTNLDAVITCWRNDLSLHSTGSPTWVQIPGMTPFIDDGAGVMSGSPGFLLGRMGWGCWFNDTNRRALFDEFSLQAQT